MSRLRDLVYGVLLLLTSPVWVWRLLRTGKWRTEWGGRFGRGAALPPARPRILLHAVSVGEINAIRLLIQRLAAARPDADIIISCTTNTGIARAGSLYGPDHHVVRFPFDFTSAVERFLDRVQPDLVALVELEVWPNFVAACRRRGIPVGVINGRLSSRSFRRYRRFRWALASSFSSLRFVAVQDADYAARFRHMGAPPNEIICLGTMKWDAAVIEDAVGGAEALAAEMGIDCGRPLIVAGSTAPGEHELLHEATPPGVQLLCAPRRPEWFEQAARALPGCARRSQGDRGSDTDRFLLDTIGELRRAYALADVVVVGRSFGHLHGSDMMEPVGLGKATVVGPAVSDFQQTTDALLRGDGIVQTSREELPTVLRALTGSEDRRAQLAANGREVLRGQQGATDRTLELIVKMLDGSNGEHDDAAPASH